MGFVLRRSLPSVSGLIALLLAVGVAFVLFLGAPGWFPPVFVIAILALQFAVNPFIIQWLVPATVIEHDGTSYRTDHVLGSIVARRCRDAGVPLVKLGIVDDGNPNAFTFGRTPRSARIWVTRGLLERLDERELDAVVTHEIGHIKHWDFAVMTVAAVVPMLLYLMYIVARGSDRSEARAVALGAYVAYLVSQFTLLALSRARELAADHWSCACTQDGDALSSALVKIAYGMGQESGELASKAHALIASGKEGKKEAARLRAGARRARSMRAMGIFEPSQAEAMSAAFASGIDPQRAVAAMRWDLTNPWAKVLQLMASHPLVARRIEALERSGLPGKPAVWSVMRARSQARWDEVMDARKRFAREVVLAVAPWVVLVPLIGWGAYTGSAFSVGVALAFAGVLFLAKQQLRYPMRFERTDEVAGLLERLDAGPVGGIGVELRGKLIGRGTPGYVLSPDLVLQDASGFVPLLYRQPIRFLATLFGLFRAGEYIGEEVVATGWYRRVPGPVVELKALRASSGRQARGWEWAARYAGAGLLVLVGLLVAASGLVG